MYKIADQKLQNLGQNEEYVNGIKIQNGSQRERDI